MSLAATEIKEMLGLKRHPTCGFITETYRTPQHIPAGALPAGYEGSRPYGSALYFLVTPEARMRLHRIRSDQMYHHYLGDPLEVLLLYPNGSGAVAVVGSELAAGRRPQLFIPGDTFHVSRLLRGGSYALLGTTAWPGVEPQDVEELGNSDELIKAFPAFQDEIKSFTV